MTKEEGHRTEIEGRHGHRRKRDRWTKDTGGISKEEGPMTEIEADWRNTVGWKKREERHMRCLGAWQSDVKPKYVRIKTNIFLSLIVCQQQQNV